MSGRTGGWIAWIIGLPVLAWFLAAGLQGFEPAWAAHAVLILVLAGALVLFARWARRGLRRGLGIGVICLALATTGVVAAAALSAQAVVSSAQALAAGRPYCIQVARNGGEYRPARAWPDLSVFTMRAEGGGLQFQHHAVLAVGSGETQSLYNWSP